MNMLRTVLVIALVPILPALGQTTWYVDDDAPGDPCPGDPTCSDPNESGTLDHPFDAIQEGINAAVDGDTVLVLDGTYTGFGNREINFEGKAIIVRSETGPGSCVVDCEHLGRGFRFSNGEGPDSIVQDLTITNGYNPFEDQRYGMGGGILCTGSSSPTIANCAIRCNSAVTGGGICCENSSDPMITDCDISANSADIGGGICCWGSDPTITYCTISENSAYGGGGVACFYSNSTLTNCAISGNSATDTAGGVLVQDSNPTLTNCAINRNTAGDSGGGVWCERGFITITNSTISWNSSAGYGGGLFCMRAADFALTNCTIRKNSAQLGGGGICCPHGDHTLTNCTFSGNTASVGGGIYAHRAVPMMTNCILWGDTPQELYAYQNNTSVTYCDVQGGWPGEGNIDVDPEFAFSGDLRPVSGSPCIDAGVNNPVNGLPADDQDGNVRPLDGDKDTAAVADIGAFEFNPTASSIALSAERFEFSGLEGGENPPDQNLYLRNVGGEKLHWKITGQPDWLTVTPSSGKSNGQVNRVTLSVGLSGRLHGLYAATLEIADPDATNSPREVVVVLSVNKIFQVPSAVPTIQAAIDVSIPGDEIHVADGTYTGAGNKNLDFGGRAITMRSVSGDPASCTIDCEGDGSGFYFHGGEGPESIVEGLTITNGSATGGGGVCCVGSSPTLTNCAIDGNSAIDGGGVCCYDGSSPAIINCTIGGNLAGEGGGVWCAVSSRPTLNNCTISGNFADHGGGVFCDHSGDATLTNCTISGNSADGRGGGVWSDSSDPVLIDCTISKNSAGARGGGVCLDSSDAVLIDCTISGNSAIDYFGQGGGVWSDSGYPMISNCVIDENSADDRGGGVWFGYGDPRVTNCTIRGNSSEDGGGVFFSWSGSSELTNCLISGNTASNSGGGIRCLGTTCSPTVTNSTISGNSASIGGGFYSGGSPTLTSCILWANTPPDIYVFSDEPVVTYCDVQGGWPGEGNIDADPLFVDPDGPDNDPNSWEDNDYRLTAGSPCIDSADNSAVPPDTFDLDGDGDTDEPTPFDLDGHTRFIDDPNTPDAGFGASPIIDMGAYEFGFKGCPDDGGDGFVTICHIPPGHPELARTITVSVHASATHLAHGDHCGACERDREGEAAPSEQYDSRVAPVGGSAVHVP